MQQVQRGRSVQSFFLLFFCLNGTFYSNKNIKMTPQRKQNCAVTILNQRENPKKVKEAKEHEETPPRADALGVKGNVSWFFLVFAFGGLSKQFGHAHFVVFSF